MEFILNKKRISIIVVILTLIMTFMEMTALPAALIFNITFKDVNPIYFNLMINFGIAFAICWLCKKFIMKEWKYGLHWNGVLEGLKKYGIPAVIATIFVTASFCIGLSPFNNEPTIWRVIIEGILYYIILGIMEELYLRGLLQNIIEIWFDKKKNASLYAVIIASLLFGLGHIVGALNLPIMTIVCKTVWATALGIYLGAVYVITRNLCVPIILHFIINLCGIPFCFSTSNQYPTIVLITAVILYSFLGIYGIYILQKKV